MSVPPIDPADEATRTLAAAVDLDDEFADQLVEEYLAEPKRAVPPSPGVRAAAVLAEAVASQARRRLSSVLVLALLIAFFCVSFLLGVSWLASALAWRVSAATVDWLSRARDGRRARLPRPWQRWCVAALLWIPFDALFFLPVALITWGLSGLHRSDSPDGPGYGAQPSYTAEDVLGVATVLLAAAILAILLTYETLRVVRATGAFGGGVSFPPQPQRRVASWAYRRFSQRLQRIHEDDVRRAHAAASHEVVVYRGYNPFVGAGSRVQSVSLALELHAVDGADPTGEAPLFAPAELHDFVSAAMDSLRSSPTLSPGFRFRGLEIAHWASVSASHALRYPEAATLLAQLNAGMNPVLTVADWQILSNTSPEWLRYFRAYRLEGWERQLGVAGFLGVGCDSGTLYLEWHGYVLPPVASRYRMPDQSVGMAELRALWRAVGELVLLPATVPGRVADLLRGVRQLRGRGAGDHWATAAQASRVYGAQASLRELAAGEELTTFFEEADSDRYLKIMERRLFDAVHRFLLSKGISTGAFDDIVTQINNSTVLDNCTVIAGNIGGQRNTGTVGAAPAVSHA